MMRRLHQRFTREKEYGDDELIPFEEVKARWRQRDRLRREGPLLTRWWIRLEDFQSVLKRRADDARYFPRSVRAFWQRGRRGWADRDVWDFNDYLARVIADGVEHHRRHRFSYPAFGDASTPEQWDAILVEIRDGFRAFAAPEKTDEETYQRGMQRFAEWFRLLWD